MYSNKKKIFLIKKKRTQCQIVFLSAYTYVDQRCTHTRIYTGERERKRSGKEKYSVIFILFISK